MIEVNFDNVLDDTLQIMNQAYSFGKYRTLATLQASVFLIYLRIYCYLSHFLAIN